jgi:hypothetical protein
MHTPDDDERKSALWPWFVVPIVVLALVVLWLLFVAPDRGSTFTYRPGE